MKIASHTLLQRGNIYTRRLAIELKLDDAENVTVSRQQILKLPKVIHPMRDWVPDYPAWRRLTRTRNDVPAAGVVEVVAALIQRYAYWPVMFCSWRAKAGEDGPNQPPAVQEQGRSVYEVGSERTGLMAGKAAVVFTTAMIEGSSQEKLHTLFFDLLGEFLKTTNQQTPAADALQIARAGLKRGIPWAPLHRSQYLRLGSGPHSYVLKGSESTNTASISRDLSRDKRLTHDMLAEAGLPVPGQRTARSERAALRHAKALGFPLVVKPIDGNMGNGVTVGVANEERLIRAFKKAQKVSRRVVLEEQIAGEEYRLLVVNGRFVAAMHRSPAQVRADGRSTVEELVAAENIRPERAPFKTGRVLLMKSIQLDKEAIELLNDQKLTLDSVPPADTIIYLRRESNLSRGGEPFDATNRIHRSIIDVAERTASVIGLDICGVDFITTDPGEDYHTTHGAICEVNSRPGINGHLHVMGESGHRITDAFLDMLYPEGAQSRIPVIALVGKPRETRELRRDIEAVATRANKLFGVIPSRDSNSTLRATRKINNVKELSWNSELEAAVIEITPKQILNRGIGLEYLDLAVMPPPDGSDTQKLTASAIDRVCRARVTTFDESDALPLALEALDLPTDAVASFPTPPLPVASQSKSSNSDQFTALFAGDVGFGESYTHRPRAAGLKEILDTRGPDYCFEKLQGLLKTADLTIANLEVPLAATPDGGLTGRKKYLGWCDGERTVAALKSAGIDAVTLANNHILDCGTAGLADTVNHLQKAGIAGFGAGYDAEAAALPFIQGFTVGGIERSLVVFGGFEHRARYNNRYRWYASRRIAGVGQLDSKRIASQIDALRGVLPNPTFVVFPHWGVDYEEVTPYQKTMAAELADAGADLIVGHGAHIAQQAEIVNGCPVIYNIGNFVWNTPGRFNKRDVLPYGLAVALRFGPNKFDGPRLMIFPILTDNAQTDFQNRLLTGEEFVSASNLLSSNTNNLFRTGRNEVGHYLEMTLSPGSTAKWSERDKQVNGQPAKLTPKEPLAANGLVHEEDKPTKQTSSRIEEPAATTNGPETKRTRLVEMLKAKNGVTVEQTCSQLGWQPNTARAALTDLRKAGYAIELMKPSDGRSGCYRIVQNTHPPF